MLELDDELVRRWIDDCCTCGREADTTANLFKSWDAYAERSGERTGTPKLLVQSLQRIGCKSVKNTPGHHNKRGFHGITVTP